MPERLGGIGTLAVERDAGEPLRTYQNAVQAV